MFKLTESELKKTVADMKGMYPEQCDSISPNDSRCTKPKNHKGMHHDYTGGFECFEMWGSISGGKENKN